MSNFYQNKLGKNKKINNILVNKEDPQKIKVFGLPKEDLLIKSRFNPEGIVRSFTDFEWALKTFEYENQSVGVIGSFVKSYFFKKKEIKFFEEKKMIKLMLKLLQKSSKNKSKRSLMNLKLSIQSRKENPKEIDEQLKKIEQNELGDSMDVSLIEEERDSPERR